ncbi:uncharacterized protein F4817DRAFT_336894 [Daldinia loculata]|uniref:uncharacterized protein n=1 Tax=Daldinia loculata TaxID=103429 RepID=UPI0020C38322|nr:uncharacterized protein F4817DRAFT_336894 [Daldinia loculata]KAI1647509.1 hypothetical protein F4817DRAFT_336894 [Daldinia loculata]
MENTETMDAMDTSSLSSAPPSSPPQLPQDHPLHDESTAVPPPTSELSELSDLPDTIPDVSDSEEEDDLESDLTQTCDPRSERVAADTLSFWRRKRSRERTFKRFMEGWLLGKTADNKASGARLREMVRAFKDPKIRERLGTVGIRIQFVGEEDKEEDKGGDKDIVPDLRDELSALVLQPAFSKLEPKSSNKPGDTPCAVKDIYNADWINSAIQSSWTEIQATSPKLSAFLTTILSNQRAGQKSYHDAKIDTTFSNEARAYLIVTLFLGAYAPKQSNFLPLSMGIYLHSNKVPRRVIDTLARFGICSGYKSIMRQLGQKPEISGDANNVSAAGSGIGEHQPVDL